MLTSTGRLLSSEAIFSLLHWIEMVSIWLSSDVFLFSLEDQGGYVTPVADGVWSVVFGDQTARRHPLCCPGTAVLDPVEGFFLSGLFLPTLDFIVRK